MSDHHELETALGYPFADSELLTRALTHPSVPFADPERGYPSNQRLEFLGDAVLGLLAADHLFHADKKADEGDLTMRRADLVKGSTLARIGRRIGISKFLLLSTAAQKSGLENHDRVIEDAVEALIGAVYLDGGMAAACSVFEELFCRGEEEVDPDQTTPDSNPKGTLQEWAQAQEPSTRPEYKLTETHGPAHNRTFIVEVYLDDKLVGSGEGSSKKEAEAQAAQEALGKIAQS